MTDAVTLPLTNSPAIIRPGIPLIRVGDPAAAACEGDFCAIPDHHEQAIVNRRLDEDLV